MYKWIRKIAVWWFLKSGWSYSGQLADFQSKTVVFAGPQNGVQAFFIGIAVLTISGVRSTMLVRSSRFNALFKTVFRGLSCRMFRKECPNEEFVQLKDLFLKRKKLTLIFSKEKGSSSERVFPELFYDLAADLNLPIVLVTIDKRRKHVKLYSEFLASNRKRDLKYCSKVFKPMLN